ncbi:histidine kinase [Chitinophaga sp. G-6-1-13]|uniref:Histidine kinase n=1 Tax=Chitinophaga fulva TaxID=2728842 RepID=A0A848GKM7_9BACT|nr:histidine kinase [Chitinophaga fulva]NML38974.1 histidine kinase [Chitinophaga fulva]
MNLLERLHLFHRKHQVWAHICFWLAVLFFSTGERNYFYREDWFSFKTYCYNGLTLITQVLTSYLLAYLIMPMVLLKRQYLSAGALFILGMYVICVLARGITVYLQEPLSGTAPKASETPVEILTNLSKLWHVYFFRNFSVAIVFLFLKLLKDHEAVRQQSLLMEKAKAAAELRVLKNQLQPHFLFNTLNNIYALSLANSPKTAESVSRLSDMLDYILYKCDRPFVLLSEETMLLKNYIALQQLRYDKKLEVNIEITETEPVQVAPMLLLTLVENAFKHGVAGPDGKKRIDINISASLSGLRCRVQNTFDITGVGNHHAIGLQNMRQQLALIYPDKYRLETTTTSGIFTVTLTLA